MKLTQEQVNRIIERGGDGPDVIGPMPPRPGPDEFFDPWECDGCGHIFLQPSPEAKKDHYRCPECGDEVIGPLEREDAPLGKGRV